MKILYAEDNLVKYMDVVQALKGSGYRDVTNARTVADAVLLFRSAYDGGSPFDVVLTDMNYPPDDGEATTNQAGEMLLHQVKEISQATPVIVVSSVHYRIDDADACIWYSPRESWDRELVNILKKI